MIEDWVILDGMLKYYMGIQHPDKLSDEEWAMEVEILKRIRQIEKMEVFGDGNNHTGKG